MKTFLLLVLFLSTNSYAEEAASTAPAVSEEAPRVNEKELLKARLAKEKQEAQINEEADKRDMVRHEASLHHVEINYVMNAFENYNFSTKTSPVTRASQGISLDWLYFPITFGLGRLGFGPNFAIYKAKSDGKISGLSPDFYTLGIKANYQFQYLLNQTLVPFVVAGADYVKLKSYSNNLISNPGTKVNTSSFYVPYAGIGLGVNLNGFDKSAASDSLVDTGIRKILLVYTFVDHISSNANRSSKSHFLGLRFEY